MDAMVLSRRDKGQVRQIVVERVAIDVVDVLIALKRATEVRFHNRAVLESAATVNPNNATCRAFSGAAVGERDSAAVLGTLLGARGRHERSLRGTDALAVTRGLRPALQVNAFRVERNGKSAEPREDRVTVDADLGGDLLGGLGGVLLAEPIRAAGELSDRATWHG